jgi:hypothetical protein
MIMLLYRGVCVRVRVLCYVVYWESIVQERHRTSTTKQIAVSLPLILVTCQNIK